MSRGPLLNSPGLRTFTDDFYIIDFVTALERLSRALRTAVTEGVFATVTSSSIYHDLKLETSPKYLQSTSYLQSADACNLETIYC